MSGSKKLQLVRNIEFQNKITPTIFQSYLLQSAQITMQKPIKQTSNKILICSDDFQNILKDVFYIHTSSIDFSDCEATLIINRKINKKKSIVFFIHCPFVLFSLPYCLPRESKISMTSIRERLQTLKFITAYIFWTQIVFFANFVSRNPVRNMTTVPKTIVRYVCNELRKQ